MSSEAVAEMIQRTRVARGLPAKIEDPEILRYVAAIVIDASRTAARTQAPPNAEVPVDDDELITGDEPEPTMEEALANAQALIKEVKQVQADYDALTPEEKASLPEYFRQFFGG